MLQDFDLERASYHQVSAFFWTSTDIRVVHNHTREGTPNPISVNAVHRRNHKVTYISGFETFGLNADNLAEGLRKACASSTTVQPDPRNPKLKQIMVQGEHVKAVAECLIAKGVQKRWIEVMNNAGVEKN